MLENHSAVGPLQFTSSASANARNAAVVATRRALPGFAPFTDGSTSDRNSPAYRNSFFWVSITMGFADTLLAYFSVATR